MNAKQIKAARVALDKSSHSTPKVVLDAFLPTTEKAGGIKLNPVTMSVIMVLERIESPFLGGSSEVTYRHIAEALFVLTQPIADTREVLSNDTFTAAVDSLADQIEMTVLLDAVPAISRHIGKAFETAIPYGHGKEGPLAGHPSQTADSGGS